MIDNATPAADSGANTSPMVMVTPRHLAGLGTNGPEAVTAPLAEYGWHSFSDERGTTRWASPNRDRCVAHQPWLPRPQDRLWHLWGRSGDHGPAAWNATFSPGCPPEVLAHTVLALAHPEFRILAAGRELEPLTDAGWQLTRTGPARCASFDAATAFRHTPAPDHAKPDEFAEWITWRAWAGIVTSTRVLWRAEFTAPTPPHLIRGFCAALADPTPLPRHPADLRPDVRAHLNLP